MKKIFALALILFSVAFAAFSRNAGLDVGVGDYVAHGYSESVEGTDIRYYSHLNTDDVALIVRARKGLSSIRWKTDPLPEKLSEKWVSFIWVGGVSGLMQGKTSVPIDLSINGKKLLTFTTGKLDSWTVEGKDGSSLAFNRIFKDGSDDCFGYMQLRVPRKYVREGSSCLLELSAPEQDSDSWSMVFKSRVPEGVPSASCLPALRAKDGKQIVRVTYTHFGAPSEATLVLEGRKYREKVIFGDNTWELPVDPVVSERDAEIVLSVDGKDMKASVKMRPSRHWDVKFMQITHTDIGYTRPQAEILAEHIRFIDYVLDYCDATDNYPDKAKFRWTCEGSWAVSAFLESRPKSQIDRFIKRVKEGRIELTAMYYNFDEIPAEQTLAASLAPIRKFHELGMTDIQVATQNDVNGIGWCFNEFFPDMGIKYLTMGVNLHKAIGPFDMPTYFWWVSPSGKKMLAYYGEHYMHGNALGVNGKDFGFFEKKMLDYLNNLDDRDFPYDIVACEFLGIGGDNSAPSTYACDIVRQWNEKYEWPKISLSLYRDYLGEVVSRYGDSIDEIRGAWPDWWTDGFGSGAAETAAHRITQSSKVATQSGLAISKLMGSELPESVYEDIDDVNDALAFYGEHTYGADASISNPFGKETMEQRFVKASYAWEGLRRERLLKEKSLGFLNEYLPESKGPSIAVFNMSSWPRTGMVEVYIDFSILPLDRKFRICDDEGNSVPAQMLRRRHDGATWCLWVNDVPAFGYKKFKVILENGAPEPSGQGKVNLDTIENEWYRIVLDRNTGTLASVYDKEMEKELIDQDAKWKTGQFIHEHFTARFEKRKEISDDSRDIPSSMTFTGYVPGKIWDTYSFAAHTETGIGTENNLRIDFLIYNVAKRIDIRYNLVKKQNTSPEGLYVAFPFELEDARIYFDVAGGEIEAGVDQIQGTSNDWNTVQNYISVRNDASQIVFVSQETPLVQLGNLNIGRFIKEAKPESNAVYSYVMNNYWTTNFNADQHGEFQWTYNITSSEDSSQEYAMKFALENRIPMLARTLPASAGNDRKSLDGSSENSFLTVTPSNVVVMDAVPMENENAIVLYLRETAGKDAVIELSSDFLPDMEVSVTNVLGEEIDGNLTMKPYEIKFVKLSDGK